MTEREMMQQLRSLLWRSDWRTATNRSLMDGLLCDLERRQLQRAEPEKVEPITSGWMVFNKDGAPVGFGRTEDEAKQDAENVAKDPEYNIFWETLERVYGYTVRSVSVIAAPQPQEQK